MAAKKISPMRLAIVNELSKKDILEALDGTFGNIIYFLNVRTQTELFSLSLISFEYEDMRGSRIKLVGINGDGKYYQVNYDFYNHNNCWIRQIV